MADLKTTCLEYTLSDNVKDELLTCLLDYKYPQDCYKNYLKNLRKIVGSMFPPLLLDLIYECKNSFSPPPAVILKNLPVDKELPSTPKYSLPSREKKTSVSENILCSLALLFGEPYAVSTESSSLVNNLIPDKSSLDSFTGLGSRKKLDFHIENSAMRYIFSDGCTPKGLILTGVRNEVNTPPLTQVSDARLALSLLSEDDIEQLKSHSYIIRVPKRWREILEHKHTYSKPVPMILGSRDRPIINAAFYDDMVHPLHQDAKRAFSAFHRAISSVSVGFVVQPGEAIYIDNRFTLHSRTPFEPYFDDLGRPSRWIQRIFVTDHLWGFRDWKNEKHCIFTPVKEALCG